MTITADAAEIIAKYPTAVFYADPNCWGVAWQTKHYDETGELVEVNSGPCGPEMDSYDEAVEAVEELRRAGYSVDRG